MPDAQSPVAAELVWIEELRFGVTSGTHALVTDGHNTAGPSPVQLLVIAVAGCMSIDIADIVSKGRHALKGLRTTVTAERAADPPRRLTSVTIRFHLHGDVPAAAVERAIALSQDKYCSVWHSMRDDIEMTTAFEVLA